MKLKALLFVATFASGACFAATSGEAVMNGLADTQFPRGKPTFINLSDMPKQVQDAINKEESQYARLTTKSGVTYRVLPIPNNFLQFIAANKAKALATKRPAPDEKAELKSKTSLKELASMAEATADGAPIARYVRVYEDGSAEVMVQRWDFAVDKGAVTVIRDFSNTNINGSPATFVAMKAPSGTIFNLSWTTERQQYEMWLKGYEDGDSAYDYMVSLAQAL